MSTVTVGGAAGRRISITVQGYERDAPDDGYDANWLACSVDVDVGRFHGSVTAAVGAGDFVRFRRELAALLDGADAVARFRTMEEALEFEISLDRQGHAGISGILRELERDGATLSFRFESDRSYLTDTRRELVQLCSAYPERVIGEH